MKPPLRWLLVASLCVLLATSVFGTVRNVPADFATVQAAIDAATSGDTVLVQPGRYKENIDFGTKNLVVASRYMLTHDPNDILQTVLDGSNPPHPDSSSVVRITGHQDQTTLLAGFTITGGKGTKWRDISTNLVYREGGGVLIEGGKPVVANNYIVDNEAINKTGTASAGGGGIRAGFGDSVTIVGNIIAYNRGLYGAGIVAFHFPALIENNVIWGNSGGQDYGGSGIWMISVNTITAPSFITNNTIMQNSSLLSGGGIQLGGTVGYLTNNIVRGNTGSGGAQLALSGALAGSTVTYNDVEGGYPGTSNTDEDPNFAPTNFLLGASSPCVDSGDPTSIFNDLLNPANPGFALPPSLGTTRNDRGAYGGPMATAFPLFTSPLFQVLQDTLDFGYIPVGETQRADIVCIKSGFVPMRIDSVVIQNGQGGSLYLNATLPRIMGATPAGDSITLAWYAQVKGKMIDTALIYHSAPDKPSPVRVIIKGLAHNCCTGTTGNVDMVGIVNLADVAFLVGYLTGDPLASQLPCYDEANVNASGIVDLADLSSLVSYLTGSGLQLPNCP